MHTIKTSDLGEVKVATEVIATLAGLAAMNCYGLVGMVPQDLSSNISNILGMENVRKGVAVKKTEDGLVIDLYVIVGYGIKIKEVANNVIQKVTWELENNAGIPVAAVNINVRGVKVLTD